MPEFEHAGGGIWEKTCSNCKEVFKVTGDTWAKARENFLQHFYHYNNGSRKDIHTSGDDLQSRCKECHSHTVHKRKHNGLKREDMLLAQDGKCVICEGTISFTGNTASVDHNHNTKEIREVLCHKCNQGIGSFKENIEFMKRAILYLEKHNGSHNSN